MDKIDVELLRNLLADRAQSITSAEADFDKLTWTFLIGQDVRVGAGEYLVMPWQDFRDVFEAARKGTEPERATLGEAASHGD